MLLLQPLTVWFNQHHIIMSPVCEYYFLCVYLAVLTQYRRVMDGQMDRQTDGRTHDDS